MINNTNQVSGYPGAAHLIDRDLRNAIRRRQINDLPLYPGQRACAQPTAARALELFAQPRAPPPHQPRRPARPDLPAPAHRTTAAATAPARPPRQRLHRLTSPSPAPRRGAHIPRQKCGTSDCWPLSRRYSGDPNGDGCADGQSRPLAEDPWTTLLRRPDITLDDRGAAWLATAAIREAWRLASRTRELPAGAMRHEPGEPGELPEPAVSGVDPAEQAVARERHRQRIAVLAQLKERERRELFLHAAGYRYREIAKLSGVGRGIVAWLRRPSVGDMSHGRPRRSLGWCVGFPADPPPPRAAE